MLDACGDYAFRLRGEDHAWTPDSVAKLQHAARGNSLAEFTAFTDTINDQSTVIFGYPGPPDTNAAQVNNTYLINQMFAKAVNGASADDAIKFDEAQLKTIYK